MTFVIIIGALILIGLAVAAIAWPLFKERNETAEGLLAEETASDPMAELLEQRDAVYQALRELRFDYQVGKVSEDDYRAFDAQLKTQAVATLKAIDALKQVEADSDLDSRIEAEITALCQVNGADSAASAAINVCPQCGYSLRTSDRFCGNCGAVVG